MLLVEDEPGLVMTLTDRLVAEGYDVESDRRRRSGLARASTGIVRRHPARRHAARRQRLRRVPHAAPARHPDADPDADRARPGRRSRRRPQARRRRLPRQAVRDGGAAGAHRGAAAPRRHAAVSARASTETYRFGDIAIDFRKAEVTKAGQTLELSAREFKLLRYFVEHRGAALSRDELLNEVWGYNAMPSTRTVDVHVAWLRQKLEDNPRHPQYIHTVHGLGYKFVG